MVQRSVRLSIGIALLAAAGWAIAVSTVPITPTQLAALAALTHFATAPKIDGSAKEWTVASRQSLTGPDGDTGSIRLGYDEANFYAFVDVKDDSPLKNSATRPEEMLKGGDAVGFYFAKPNDKASAQRVMVSQIDGKNLVYLYKPQSQEKKPYTFASPVGEAKFDYVAPLPSAKLALRPSKNGYVLELAIPWKALGWDAPPTRFSFDSQIIYSDPAGTTNASMAWWHAKGGPGDTVEDLPSEARLYPETWGEATLDTENNTIALAPPVTAGADAPVNEAPVRNAPTRTTATAPANAPAGIPIRFDLPRAGRVSLVVTDQSGWIVRELLSAEKRAKGEQTVAWDGRDRYGEPLPPGKYHWKALLFDGMGAKFYGSIGNSGRPPYRTPDGLGSMGGQHGVPTTVATDEGGIYMGGGTEEGQPAVRKIDPKTGEAIWKRSVGGFGAAAALTAGENRACYINISGGRGDRVISLVQIDPRTGRDIPKNARLNLPITLPERDKIRFLFGGLAIAGGRAYWSETLNNRIAGADLDTGKLLPPITVDVPQGLARLDAENLLVCSDTQVLKLNVASGRTTPVLTGLTAPRAVARDSAGNYYVSDLGESQQIKKFSSDGKLLASWGRKGGKPLEQPNYDPMAFENVTGLVVGSDGNLWFNEASETPKRFVKLGLDGHWLEDIYGPIAYNTFGPDLDDFSTVYCNTGGNDATSQILKTKLDYAKYTANPNDPAAGWKIEAIYDLALGADGKSRNALVGEVAQQGYGHIFGFTGANGKKYLFRPSKTNRAVAPPGAALWVWDKERWVPAAFISRDEKKAGTSWSDFNGDGLVQENERYSLDPAQTYAWIGRDLALQGFDGTMATQKVDARGVPDYRGATYAPYLKANEPNYRDGWTFVSPKAGDAVYYVANTGSDRHLAFWDRSSENRLIKVENGRVQWVMGQHERVANFTAWDTVTGIAGVVDDLVLVHTVSPYYYAVTTDGFNLGNVLADANGQVPSVGPTSINIESFTGLFAKDPKTGKKILFSVSSGDDRILEITGPGEMTRLDGEIALDTPRPRIVEAANATEIPYQNWIGNNASNLSIDGDADEWPLEEQGLPIYDGNVLIGDIRLRRDSGNLYVLADVLDPTPLENGEGIELSLASENGEATTIFLSAAKDNKGTWKGTATAGNAPAAKTKVAAALRWRDLGYRLEAELPLDLWPNLTAPRTQKVRTATKDARTGKLTAIESKTASVPDLRGPIRLKAAILRRENGAVSRNLWPASATGTNANWGTASTP